ENIPEHSLWVRVVYSSWFYLSIASGLGAIAGWLVLEPFFDDKSRGDGAHIVAAFLMFPTVAGFIGLFLGSGEGVMCRNLRRACLSGAVGLGVGFVGGLILWIPVEILFHVAQRVAFSLDDNPRDGEMPLGFGLLVLMMGRGLAWAFSALPAGLGQGLALRDKKVSINGLLGGLMGGLAGGMLFDPIAMVFTTSDGQANASRGIGFAIIGILVGLFVGLVDSWTKSAWLLMRQGPLAGKQFVLYREATVLGSAPQAEVYLFKDAAIEPRHAVIHNRGGRFEIEDCDSADGTYVNGIPVTSQWLQAGDQIVLGKTVLEFVLKETA
ncbi:MAG: FHA domain-containing protein, partial [Planctomycetales bacterium]